jgi:peptidoglycan L-alanyl-D-glutamate endopeptidase CwlK
MTDHLDPHRLHRLRGCHPELKARVIRLVEALAHEGLDIVLTQGVRSTQQQAALYAQGRYKPGKVVTNCDGLIKVSNHQPKADGYGYAVDVAWVIEGRVTWEGPWDRLGTLAEAQGLVWGGRWVSFPDRPHVELHPGFHVPIVVNA